MEIRDGFIVSIFNYCDRWCEKCAFTSRCRLFADQAELEASLDPNLQPVTDAPVLPEEEEPPPPRWMRELIEEMNEAARDAASLPELKEPELPPEHQELEDRAHAYLMAVHAWLRTRPEREAGNGEGPLDIIAWYHTLFPVKMHSALHALAEDDAEEGEEEWRRDDTNGRAKVALLGIERSHAAWLDLVAAGEVREADAAPFIADLVWLGAGLERAFPQARSFVRPGLDEPEEVARLDARGV